MALNIADIIVAPFGSFMDADFIVRHAASDIPRRTHLMGLPVDHGADILDLVEPWLHVTAGILPKDERLMLFSERSDAFFAEMIAAGPSDSEANAVGLEASLRALAQEIRRETQFMAEAPDAFEPAPALLLADARLARAPERAFA